MRIVIVGATGNVGTSVLRALAADPSVTSVLGVARRTPDWEVGKGEWAAADIATAELAPVFSGADAVVHCAWAFQPTHDPAATWETNVLGSSRLFEAVAQARVPTLVYASSVGAYSPGPKDRAVDESWPTHGWPGASYTREKAYVERVLDGFETAHPDCRVVRLRPGFIFRREATQEQRRMVGGPLMPNADFSRLPVVPDIPALRFQVVSAADAAEAYRLAVLGDARGAFNIAAEPVIGTPELAEILGARPVRMPAAVVRTALAAGWYLSLIPASPGLFDAILRLPIMDTTRARTVLRWEPRQSATETLKEFLTGLREREGAATQPLVARTGDRIRELLGGRRTPS